MDSLESYHTHLLGEAVAQALKEDFGVNLSQKNLQCRSWGKGVVLAPKTKRRILACISSDLTRMVVVGNPTHRRVVKCGETLNDGIKAFQVKYGDVSPDQVCIMQDGRCHLYDASIFTE